RGVLLEEGGSGGWQALGGRGRPPGWGPPGVTGRPWGCAPARGVISVVNPVLLEPLPYHDSDRLVRIVQRAAPANPSAPLLRRSDMSQVELGQWRKSTRTLSAMAISMTPPITLMPTASGSARLTGSLISANTFAMLGARAQLGRTLEPADAAAGSNVVVISARAWQRYFQSDPNILGRTIALKTQGPEAGLLDGTSLTIVGVVPSSFDFPQPNSDYWAPIAENSPARARLGGAMGGRLAEGVPIQAATDEANAIGESLRPRPTSGLLSRPLPQGVRRFAVEGVKEQIVAASRPALRVIAIAVAAVLLIVCAN